MLEKNTHDRALYKEHKLCSASMAETHPPKHSQRSRNLNLCPQSIRRQRKRNPPTRSTETQIFSSKFHLKHKLKQKKLCPDTEETQNNQERLQWEIEITEKNNDPEGGFLGGELGSGWSIESSLLPPMEQSTTLFFNLDLPR